MQQQKFAANESNSSHDTFLYDYKKIRSDDAFQNQNLLIMDVL